MQQIADGEFKEGDQLPSERQLSEQYNISRVTVRQALSELVRDGVLVKQHGRGNFVAPKRIEQRLDSLLGFIEEFAIRNMSCEIEVRRKEYVIPPPEVHSAMQGDPKGDQKMLMVVRKIIVENKPLGIDYTYMPKNIAYLLEGHNDIIYRHLERNGYKLTTADQTISAGSPNSEEARVLGLRITDPVLVINRVAYVEGNRPILYNRTVYRADRYSYTLTLKRYPHSFD